MDKLDRQQLAASYGFALSFMRSDKELWGLFRQAVKETWNQDRFVAKLRSTKWFQKNSANVRNSIMQETADPATYKANVDQMYASVRDTFGAMFGSAGMSNKQLRTWAETAHRMGWSEAELVDRLTKGVDIQKQMQKRTLGGRAAETAAQLGALVNAYGLELGENWQAHQVKKLVSGDDSIGGVQKRLQDLAMREYKAFADQIAGGQTVEDIAEPYRQQMAALLELNPADVKVTDKTIQRALKQRAKDGKPAAMDLTDFADMVRQDDRWQYTDNAHSEMSELSAYIGRAFGRVS